MHVISAILTLGGISFDLRSGMWWNRRKLREGRTLEVENNHPYQMEVLENTLWNIKCTCSITTDCIYNFTTQSSVWDRSKKDVVIAASENKTVLRQIFFAVYLSVTSNNADWWIETGTWKLRPLSKIIVGVMLVFQRNIWSSGFGWGSKKDERRIHQQPVSRFEPAKPFELQVFYR